MFDVCFVVFALNVVSYLLCGDCCLIVFLCCCFVGCSLFGVGSYVVCWLFVVRPCPWVCNL